MKQHAASVSKAIKDIERVSQEVKNLETDLEATGSSRTADDVQSQLNDVSVNLSVVPSCFLRYHARCTDCV
jgi:DNA repair protein RAD50